MSRPTYAVILLAAGSGMRFGGFTNKVFMPIKENRPVFDYSLSLFLEDTACRQIYLMIQKKEEGFFRKLIELHHKKLPDKISFIQGGDDRQSSVRLGVEAVDSSIPYLLVHDAARPLITQKLVREVFEAAIEYKAASLAIPTYDTVNRVVNERAVETLDRSEIWNIQTPQAFERNLLEKAMEQGEKDKLSVNEEGQLILHYGHLLQIVEGSKKNIKMTRPVDLEIIRALS